jgi:S1-C subfamily serine protease
MTVRLVKTAPALLLGLLLILFDAAGSQPSAAMSKDARPGLLRASVKLMTPFEFSKDAGSLCSGTTLSQEGYILTNFHCVGYATDGERDRELDRAGLRPGDLFNRQGTSIVAVTNDARQLPVPTYVARVLAADPDLDLAVLKIVSYINSKQPLPKVLPIVSLALGDSDLIEALDEVVVIGYPGIGGDTVTATEGRISGFVDVDEDGVTDWIKTDVLINQGNSGGSAVNDKGELIGVPTARLQDRSGNVIYLVRPSNNAVALIKRAMKAGESTSDAGGAVIGSPKEMPRDETIGEPVFGTGFSDNDVTDPAHGFASGTAEIHAAVPYQNMRDGTRWGYAWRLSGQTVTGESNLKWKYGPSGVLDLYLRSKKGLPDGAYTLQILLGDTTAQEGYFIIGAAEFKSTPQKPSNEERRAGVTITGVIIDRSTRRPIQGAAIAFLWPGKTVGDFDADRSKGKTDTVQSYGVTNANGGFTSDAPLTRGQVYSVVVGAKGYQRIAEDDALDIYDDEPDIVQLDSIEMDRQ